MVPEKFTFTGKSFAEVLTLASTNTKYDKRLSIELQVQYMKIPSSASDKDLPVFKVYLSQLFDI